MSPPSIGGGRQALTGGEHISHLVETLIGRFFFLKEKFEQWRYKPGTNAPPMHCWCRSCIAPYFDDMEMLGKRAARNPETGKTILVSEDMTYREWEKKYEAPISGKQTERTDSNPISDEPVESKVPSVDSVIDKLNGHTLEQRFFKSDYDAVQKLHAERLAEYEKAQEKASELDLEFIINATEESHKAALKASELRDKALKAMQETEAAIKAARSVYQAQIESKILGENLASGIKLSPEMDIEAMDTVYNVAKMLVKDYNLPMLPGVEYRPGFFKMLGSKAHATYDWNKKKIYLNETFANPAEYVQHRKFVEQQYKDRKASLKEVYENQLKGAEENYKNAEDKGRKAMAQSSINYAKAELTQNRYAVAETIDDTLIHEYGHYLHDTLSYWEKGFHLFGSKSMKSVKINNEYFWNNSLAGKVEAAKVSGYATENPLECFAESFNAFMKGKKLPDSLDKMMREAFEKTGAKIPKNSSGKAWKDGLEADIIKKKNFDELKEYIGKLDNKTVREWYVYHDERIYEKVDKTKSTEEQARQACSLRNNYRTQARDLMADQEARKDLDIKHPNKSFEQLLKDKMRDKKMTREQAIEDIYNTAMKTNATVNAKYGLGDHNG